MGKIDKLVFKILRGNSDSNINFDEIKNLLLVLGFDMRIKGSHHIFRKQGIEEKINLQTDGAKAKPYQVRQVRSVIIKYKLLDEFNV